MLLNVLTCIFMTQFVVVVNDFALLKGWVFCDFVIAAAVWIIYICGRHLKTKNNLMDYRDELKELLVCQFGVVASMSEIDDGTELFLLGIDELDMLRLSMLIEERLGVCVPSFVLETEVRTFGDLAEQVYLFA